MKRIFSILLATLMFSVLAIPASAAGEVFAEEKIDKEKNFCAISALDEGDEGFQNEDGCSSEVVCVAADENNYQANEHMNGSARETTVPKTFYNIASSGIYKGSFYELRGTMYTSKYFNTQNAEYYSRVRCYGEHPNLTYKVGNYCIDCKRVLSITDSDFYTPSKSYEVGNWVSIRHEVSSSHNDHFVCPFVTNTSGVINGELYFIAGDIWVNYTDSWG